MTLCSVKDSVTSWHWRQNDFSTFFNLCFSGTKEEVNKINNNRTHGSRGVLASAISQITVLNIGNFCSWWILILDITALFALHSMQYITLHTCVIQQPFTVKDKQAVAYKPHKWRTWLSAVQLHALCCFSLALSAFSLSVNIEFLCRSVSELTASELFVGTKLLVSLCRLRRGRKCCSVAASRPYSNRQSVFLTLWIFHCVSVQFCVSCCFCLASFFVLSPV